MAIDYKKYAPLAALAGGAAIGAGTYGMGAKPARTFSVPRLDPNQMALQQQIGQQAQGGLANLQANKPSFDPIRQQAEYRLQNQTLPGIAERFSGLGAGNSSYYANALAGAQGQLASDLAAQEAQFNLANRGQEAGILNSLSSMALAPNQEFYYEPEKAGFGQGLLSQLGQWGPMLLQLYMQQMQGDKSSGFDSGTFPNPWEEQKNPYAGLGSMAAEEAGGLIGDALPIPFGSTLGRFGGKLFSRTVGW